MLLIERNVVKQLCSGGLLDDLESERIINTVSNDNIRRIVAAADVVVVVVVVVDVVVVVQVEAKMKKLLFMPPSSTIEGGVIAGNPLVA